MATAPPRGLGRTVRVLGVAVTAGNRALDLALVETDGADHVRLVENERQPLPPGPILAAVVQVTRAFLGDRTLQPFALDRLALYAETPEVTVAALAAGTEVDTCLAPTGAPRRTRAEQAAFAAVATIDASRR